MKGKIIIREFKVNSNFEFRKVNVPRNCKLIDVSYNDGYCFASFIINEDIVDNDNILVTFRIRPANESFNFPIEMKYINNFVIKTTRLENVYLFVLVDNDFTYG